MRDYIILLVDDDPLILKGIGKDLEDKGYKVITAESGEKATKLIRDTTFDLVITDLTMEEIDGIQILKKTKELNPDTMVIILTGFGDLDSATDAIRLNADDYLLKPCEPEEISFRVSRCLEKLELKKKARWAAESLSEIEERYRQFVEGTDDLMIRVDSEGRFVYVNPATEKIFGICQEKCVGMSTFDFVHPEDRERTKGEFDSWVRNGVRSATIENRHINQVTGEVNEMFWNLDLHYDENGNLTGINGIARDLTERKKLEEVLLKTKNLESLGTLAGGIAHDFNNLLSIIMANLSLAEEDIKPKIGTSEFLKEAEKASIRAKDLTAKLITFSKGWAPVKKVVFIDEFVRDTVSSLLSDSDIDCEFSIHDDLWPVQIDEIQIKQVLHNIVINCREAMTGEGTIMVYCENVTIGRKDALTLKDGKYVKISIKDQGAGIPKEDLPKIFDPYFSTKEMGTEKGMGLGLAVCHSIIEKHEGLITVESELGIGTTCHIYLPGPGKEIAVLEPVKKPVSQRPVMGRGRILVMDDEKMIRDFAPRILRRLGYDSEVCKDGAEVIELYKKAKESGEPFGVVILDLTNQLGMGGKETLKRLLEIDPDVKGIVSTGYSDDPVVFQYREYGFRATLTKPYTIDELSMALQEVISEE